jgi:hypothetical protein
VVIVATVGVAVKGGVKLDQCGGGKVDQSPGS